MKKIVICLVIIAVLFCSCKSKAEYNYMNDISEISAVEIVELSEFDDETYEFLQIVLCEIDDIERFIDELSKIDCAIHYTDPVQLNTGDTVIKIEYNNGEYELICADAQHKYRLDRSSYGYQEFDKEQFEALIFKYFTKTGNYSMP